MSKNKQKHVSPIKSIAICLVCFLLIAATGVGDRYLQEQETDEEALQAIAERLPELPVSIDGCTATEHEIPRRHLVIAGATGSLARTYTDGETGDRFDVMLLCGPHGPISLHPPTVCFTGAGWVQKTGKESKPHGVSPSQGEFWECQFEKETNLRENVILTSWAWNDGSGWTAADDPRYQFARSPYLLKLYVSTPYSREEEALERRNKFVAQLLQSIDESIMTHIQDSDSISKTDRDINE